MSSNTLSYFFLKIFLVYTKRNKQRKSILNVRSLGHSSMLLLMVFIFSFGGGLRSDYLNLSLDSRNFAP